MHKKLQERAAHLRTIVGNELHVYDFMQNIKPFLQNYSPQCLYYPIYLQTKTYY